jgi:serine phosphatase RsbU (regulator of sigma subunit)
MVSGDFYWFEELNGTAYLAAADCTGHGVPGAMVSVVCSNALNRSVNEFGITKPSEILDKTRELVIETFAKSGDEVKDGMDISLCAFKSNQVIFSGANNPLWIVRKTNLLSEKHKQEISTIIQDEFSLIEYKGNKQPIGIYSRMKAFTQEEIELHPGDTLYFFTDGFADQFGGKKGKKFMYKPFKLFLIELQAKPMADQKQLISTMFENWKADLEQIDDVCVIGVKI